MERRRISTGSPFEEAGAFSRAVVDGDWCWVAGTTGYDYAAMTMPDDVSDQATNAMETISRVLAQAGFGLADVVRATYYVTDAAMAEAVFAVVRSYFEGIAPAATMIVCGLIRPEMKVEIQVTAKRQG